MSSVYVLINTFAKVREFQTAVSKFDGRFELLQGHYIVNAKSLLGIFGLDISCPIRLDYTTTAPVIMVEDALKPFVTEDPETSVSEEDNTATD